MMQLAHREPQPIIEMNTTPLIDVMLVLLIMFIITIPIQSNAVKVDLPSRAPLMTNAISNVLTIEADGTARWNGVAASDSALMATLAASQRLSPVPELHLQPDAAARYARVDQVLAMTKRAHVTSMGFVGNEQYGRF
jgi:biopolymer transport protein ExbD